MNRHERALLKLDEGTVIPASPLALNAEKKLDEKRQRALIRYYIAAGVGGLAVAVHTTQFAIRDPQIGLFEPVLRIAGEEVEEYEKKTCEAIVKVAGACGPVSQAVREAETAKDVVRATAMSSRVNKIALYTGNDDNIVIDLLTRYCFNENGNTYEKNFVGGLLGHWAVWTNTVVKMFKKIKDSGKMDCISKELLILAAEVTDANAAFFDTANSFKGCIAGLHEVLRRQGIMEGIWCLDENETLSPGQREEIDRVYRMYPHLNDDKFVTENIKKWF